MSTFYVAPGGTGTSLNHWSTGLTPGDLETTINSNTSLAPGDEIWVLQGNYLLRNPLAINMPLCLYGGFLGNEITLAQRNASIICNNASFPNFFQTPSILNGAAHGGHIIGIAPVNYCVIDGFVIESGGIPNAGVGGGIYAMGNNNFSSPLSLENLVFRDNNAQTGGGAYIENCSVALLKNVIFYKNNVGGDGGGLFMKGCQNVKFVNGLFYDNQANRGGGVFVMNSLNTEIINNTFSTNIAGIGSGIYCDNSAANMNINVFNSILYPDQFDTNPGAIRTVNYCLLGQNNIPGIGNIPLINPLFIIGGVNFHLQPISVCIDSGNVNLVIQSANTDLEGNTRFLGNRVDMGAFECF